MAWWNVPFGFQIRKTTTEKESFVPPKHDDGAIERVSSGAGFNGYNFGFEFQPKNEVELINKYRSVQLLPELDSAIEDIVSEAIVVEQFDEEVVRININAEDEELPEQVRELIVNEFENIIDIIDFNSRGHEYFRQWYVDGRIYFHIVVDEENLASGIKEIRSIDPRKIRKVREVRKDRTGQGLDVITNIDEYFVFNDSGITENSGVRLSVDTIAYTPSGLIDENNQVISYLHKALKPANMLRMIEDSFLIYFLTRAPDRRVFYVDVSGMPKTKAEQYLKDVMTRYKNKVVYNSCFSMDTKIPLLDGRVLTIAEMQKEHEAGKEMWIYSCNPVTGKFAPGLVSSAGVTKFNQKVMRLTLDNGKNITCTLDHKFPVWGKGKTEAKDLVVGDSMVPLYRRSKEMAPGKEYEQIWDNDVKKWIYTHRAVSTWKDSVGMDNSNVFCEEYEDGEKNVIHHKNFNKFDNTPMNLTMMNDEDHLFYHQTCGRNGGLVTAKWEGETGEINRKKHSESQTIEFHPEMVEYFEHLVKMNMSVSDIMDSINSSIHISKWKEINSTKKIRNKQWGDSPFNRKDLDKISKKLGFEKFTAYRDSVLYRNHKIVKIEFLEETMDVGTLGIDKDEIYHDHHTFALDAGIYTFNSTGEIRDDRHHMSMMEDYWMPRQSNGRATEITTLQGSQIQGQDVAVQMFKDKLAKSLNLPPSRFQNDTPFNIGRSMEITRDEVKFSKFISRLRKKFCETFSQLLRVQLILKGIIAPEDWNYIKSKIQYDFVEDNNFSELRDNEILEQRLKMYQEIQPLVGVHFSDEYVKKKILRMTEEEIEEENKRIEVEREKKIALMKKYPELYGPESQQGFPNGQ